MDNDNIVEEAKRRVARFQKTLRSDDPRWNNLKEWYQKYFAEHTTKRTIRVKSSCFISEFEMIIPIPEDKDSVEYIDGVLESVLKEDLLYNVEWDFVDGI